ncbi:hypothetical protein NDU88_004853 [Pleurodeles waltl]|uniref:SPIN-DOC-like zinc-finger domain-containing protein n=1 Tax=Pleurodeles waltl TaxID=8319 RepID=A0AAV7LJX0_PLEWA|nr:hypothetical protein NDU88_004853 [Pleurodeles waltl]
MLRSRTLGLLLSTPRRFPLVLPSSRNIQTTAVCLKNRAARVRVGKGDKPVTYEEALAPHHIAHRKGWLSQHTSNLDGEEGAAERTVEDVFIRKFIFGTFHGCLANEIVIKRALFDMATIKKQRTTEDENREFKVEWAVTFAFIQNLNGLLTCLICQEKLAHIKKPNLESHFTTKHVSFSTKYPVGDARKKAVEELQKRQEKSSSVFNYWTQSSNNVTIASFVVSQEIAKRGNPDADCEYIKSCFINASEELFRDFQEQSRYSKKN